LVEAFDCLALSLQVRRRQERELKTEQLKFTGFRECSSPKVLAAPGENNPPEIGTHARLFLKTTLKNCRSSGNELKS
jgi:hypothetical protein